MADLLFAAEDWDGSSIKGIITEWCRRQPGYSGTGPTLIEGPHPSGGTVLFGVPEGALEELRRLGKRFKEQNIDYPGPGKLGGMPIEGNPSPRRADRKPRK
jgi:hypothetical protein